MEIRKYHEIFKIHRIIACHSLKIKTLSELAEKQELKFSLSVLFHKKTRDCLNNFVDNCKLLKCGSSRPQLEYQNEKARLEGLFNQLIMECVG